MAYQLGNDSIDLDGVRLECRWIGPPPDVAPTIVMLHEGLGSAALWRDFPEKLSERTGCGIFIYSRQGYGASDPIELPRPITYMHEEATSTLPSLLDTIDFRRGILLGHSDGGSIATIYAGSHADHRVRGLVLFAPHFFVEDLSVQSISQAKTAYEKGDLKTRLERHHGANVDAAFYGWSGPWLDPKFRDWDLGDCLAHIRVPILIVQGDDDRYGTSAQLSFAERETYSPVDAVLLLECGHAPQTDQPERTLKETTDFLRRLLVTHNEAAPLRISA